ncbi:MAG: T9SS type A sorting domain-containing protein [Bacteroidia bacterium]
MRKLLIVLIVSECVTTFSQTLNLPTRLSTALSGSQFEATIASSTLSLTNRENMIYAQVSAGNVPTFYRTLTAVTSTATISSVTQSVTYYVAPDYLCIGCDTDYFLMPMSPMLATRIGNLTGTTLPTRKMVGDIWSAASVKLAPQPLTASSLMSTVPYFAHHDSIVGQQRATFSNPLGSLTSGDKKDVVISNMIYTTANRVIIFGWYYQNGTYIQPMTNVHADTYMDYSHGIRLVQNSCMLNGTTPTTIQSILQSSTYNTLLSDEGVIAQPWYPYGITINTPKSFALLNNSTTSLKLTVKNDPMVTHYNIYTSTNGTTYSSPILLPKSNLVLSGLTSNQIYFVKISAYDSINSVTSAISEVLAAVPTNHTDSTLLVNGFDRAITGNTYNFTIQHGTSFYNNNKYVESCTNEAVTDNLVSLNNYRAVDWILGEESTADTTFTPNEQTYVTSYLQQGGYLFTSGSEIGWDLDHSGTTADKQFYTNYLKASYVADDPNNTAGTYYTSLVNPIATSIFANNDTISFDNGTHGTYNVNYPDVITTINGSLPDMHYTTSNTDYACLHYAGVFNGGTKTGKLVYLAYPFETIYPAAKRDTVMKDVLIFFFGNQSIATGINQLIVNSEQVIVYPNPATDVLNVECLTLNANSTLVITDMLGNTVKQVPFNTQHLTLNIGDLAEGVYQLIIHNSSLIITKKFIIAK